MREDVRAVVALWLMKRRRDGMTEVHPNLQVVDALQVGAQVRARVANPLRARSWLCYLLPAPEARGRTCWLSVVGRSRSCTGADATGATRSLPIGMFGCVPRLDIQRELKC